MDNEEAIALGLTLVVHIIAIAVLVAVLIHGDETREPGGWWRWLRPDGPAPLPQPPPDDPDGLALPRDAAPAATRLRDHGRLADAHEGPARRPRHAPTPARAPTADPVEPDR